MERNSETTRSVNHPNMIWEDRSLLMEAFQELPHMESSDTVEQVKGAAASQIQEATAIENQLLARRLACSLIDSKSALLVIDQLPIAIGWLEKTLYRIDQAGTDRVRRHQHMLNVLTFLKSDKSLVQLIQSVSAPFQNPHATHLIRCALGLPQQTQIGPVETRRALLSAWLSYLRQNVGSCFATAPAILIHQEQPEKFLQDMIEILSKGSISRIIQGLEASVPMSTSWGSGDLKKVFPLFWADGKLSLEIWRSPGLISALQASSLLPKNLSYDAHESELKKKVLALFADEPPSHRLWTAQELILRLLLKETNHTYADWESSHSPLSDAMMNPFFAPPTKKQRSLQEVGKKFLTAKEAFVTVADHPLLKTWEFTLASFSEIKFEFSKWNLYASLGLETNAQGGIGPCIYETIHTENEAARLQIEELQAESDLLYPTIRSLETRMRHISSEGEAAWIKSEYQSRVNELHAIQERARNLQRHSADLVNLYDNLYASYKELFPHYFQEIYDPDIDTTSQSPFDDRPAGFRLVYKHGRSNPSQWTLISSPEQFSEALVQFFLATEHYLHQESPGEHIENTLRNIITSIVTLVRTRSFLEGALGRTAQAYGEKIIANPLDHLQQIEKKPWVYTSGGTMSPLIECYFLRETKPKQIEKRIESPLELLLFIIDTLKQIPERAIRPYIERKREYILMESPTHAFLCTPTRFPFNETWINNSHFTYTYIRDRFLLPAQQRLNQLLIQPEAALVIVERMAHNIPPPYRARLFEVLKPLSVTTTPLLLREAFLNSFARDPIFRKMPHLLGPDLVDHLLYSMLPLFPSSELMKRMGAIIHEIPEIPKPLAQEAFSQLSYPRGSFWMSADTLQDATLLLIGKSIQSLYPSFDARHAVRTVAARLEYALPLPLVFADSNWVRDDFGFHINPGTGQLDFWRFDHTMRDGWPLSSWKQWWDGSRKDGTWNLYSQPWEYGQI